MSAGYRVFIYESPLYCPHCGVRHTYLQSSKIGGGLIVYKKGAGIDDFKETAILKENVICLNGTCDKVKEDLYAYNFSYYNYIVIEKGIYKGIAPSLDLALTMFDDEKSEENYELWD
jgi:hypothetical protein